MRGVLGILFAVLLLPAAAMGSAFVGSDCDGTTITIDLDIFNDLGESYTGMDVFIEYSMVGQCGPAAPLALPAILMPTHFTGNYETFTVAAPANDQFYAFQVYVMLGDGTRENLTPGIHEAGCGQAVAARGFLVTETWGVTITPCPDNCWTGVVPEGGMLDVSAVAPDSYQGYVDTNTAVDLYGIPGAMYPMPIDHHLRVTEVLPTVGGVCGPVSTDEESWGRLKARFR